MRVIEDRSMQSEHFPLRWDCGRCHSTLEAETDDVKKGSFGPNWGGESPHNELYLECPVCGNNKVLSLDERRKVPIAVRQRLGFR